jgi:ribosomal protein L11 methyltransferase
MNLGQLECPLDVALAEDLSLSLEEFVVSSSWYEVKPENWVFQALFKEGQETLLREKITLFFVNKNLPIPAIEGSILPDEDWMAAVYRGFPPLTIGRFYIFGSHIDDDLPPELIPLRIDAATAFGSGQHESTEGCLKALSLLTNQQSFAHPLDMGCGSGILALAMARLWEVPVQACDNDPEAVRVTLENGRKNSVEGLIHAEVSEGFSSLKNKTFDIITANILAGPLCQMAEDAAHALMPGGVIVLSGLLNRQAEDVIDAYRSVGIRLINQIFIGDWSTLIMGKEMDE